MYEGGGTVVDSGVVVVYSVESEGFGRLFSATCDTWQGFVHEWNG